VPSERGAHRTGDRSDAGIVYEAGEAHGVN
jgi:hypothetical protein